MGVVRVDFHAAAAESGVDLDQAFEQLRALYDEIDARNRELTKDLDLPCHKGCDACCYESVFLTPLEFFYVWSWVQGNLPAEVVQDVVDTGLKLYEQHAQAIEALVEPPEEDAERLSIAQQIKFKCPLLGPDGACRVYERRELYARMFGCSFNEDNGVYGCHLVGAHLAGKTVTLLRVRTIAMRLNELPLTHMRQVYPYYINMLFGEA